MKRDELKAIGLTDEQIDKVMAANGQDIEAGKTKLTAATTEAEALKAQLTEAGKQIEAFKGMNIDQIKASADEWKTKAEQATADAQAQMAALRFDHALEAALTGAKAKDVVSVKANLKLGDLKLAEDGSIVGLNEQLAKVKETKDFLFESDKPAPKIVTGGNNQSIMKGDAITEIARKAAGLPAGDK
jgi:hypothetical protein